MSSSVRSRDPVVSRCEVEAADDTQDHHRRCRQAWRSSSLAAAVGAGAAPAASSQNMARNMLQESAKLLRETIQPALSSNINSIDKQIRLVFSAAGPSYVPLECIGEMLHVRRVRNLYYTHSFADLIMREMVMGHAQATCLA
eukprot:s5032_g3.t1